MCHSIFLATYTEAYDKFQVRLMDSVTTLFKGGRDYLAKN